MPGLAASSGVYGKLRISEQGMFMPQSSAYCTLVVGQGRAHRTAKGAALGALPHIEGGEIVHQMRCVMCLKCTEFDAGAQPWCCGHYMVTEAEFQQHKTLWLQARDFEISQLPPAEQQRYHPDSAMEDHG